MPNLQEFGMSLQRPLGPIGHCSAKLRLALEIEEEEALGRTVRIRAPVREAKGRGNRWSRAANFAVPGAFYERFVAADGRSTFHFELSGVTKTADGGCRITTSKGSKRLSSTAPADHDTYIERTGAVETISPERFDGYAERAGAVETIGDEVAVFSNIAPTRAGRQAYWRAVYDHERTPGPDRLTLIPDKAPRPAWQHLADLPSMPDAIRHIASTFATTPAKRQIRSVELSEMDLDSKAARALARKVNEVLGTRKGRQAVRVSTGRGGRCQYRLTAEFPDGLDASGRIAVATAFCAEMCSSEIMYVAAIHAPDCHNDRRNYHLHIAFHDRPAKMIGNRWDFEIVEPVPNQHGRVRYPKRQPKVAGWSRNPEGGNHRQHGREMVAEMREWFADRCNKELERLGANRRLHPGDLRSIGCDRQPQEKLGTRLAPLEAAGVPTSIGITNAERLWTSVLREAWDKAERRAEARAKLRQQIADAEKELITGGMLAVSAIEELRDLGARLDNADAILRTHDAELAEYDVTLAMARARPTKALDTCNRILSGIASGKASLADQRAQIAIAARAAEAVVFLEQIASIERQNAPVLETHRSAISMAQIDVDDVLTAAVPLLEERVTAMRITSNDRAILEALFKRIMADDIPILLPNSAGLGYRVPGVTKAEFRVATKPAFRSMVVMRLAELAKFQAKRMHTAALAVAGTGLPELEAAAARDEPGAQQMVKHAHAYANHEVYQQALHRAELARSAAQIQDGTSSTSRWSAIRHQLVGRMSRDRQHPSLATAPVASQHQLAAALPLTSASIVSTPISGDVAVDALATALLAEPNLRVVERGGHLAIDTSDAPDWQMCADAFAERPSVAAAMRTRFESPWLDVSVDDRARQLKHLEAALQNTVIRPLVNVGGRWRLDLADEGLVNLVERWTGFRELEFILAKADFRWTDKEQHERKTPTSVWRDATIAGKGAKLPVPQNLTSRAKGSFEPTVDQVALEVGGRGAGR